MLVKEIMTKNVITTSPDETIGQALAKMRKHRIHQLPVMKGDSLAGMLIINKVIIHEFDPSTTKVSAVMTSTPTIKQDFSVEEAAEFMINANTRAIPVVERGLIGIVSESDLMKAIKLKAGVDEFVKECSYVSDVDNVGKVKKIFVYQNVSRVPVVKNGKFIGIVGTLDLIALLEPGKEKYGGRTAGAKDRGYREKMGINETSVTTIMRQPVVVSKTEHLGKVISLLNQNEEVLVENGMLGIITPKDILQKILTKKESAYYQIAGLDDINDSDVAKIQQAVDNTIKRLAKMAQLQPMNAKIKKIKKQSAKVQYEIHVQLPTNMGTFVVSKVTGWNVITAMQEAMNNLEREMKKKYEKIKKSDRATRAYMRGK
jgi:CBS domain-containing protein